MAENSLTHATLAKKIGISENSFTIKINGTREWKFIETLLISQIFNKDIKEVFPEIYKEVQKVY